MKHRTHSENGRRGSYSIEGALTITIFTICMLAFISIMSIMRVEGEIQDAIDRTALQISQYAYAVEKVENSETGSLIKNAVGSSEDSSAAALSATLRTLYSMANSGGNPESAALAGLLTSRNFSRENASEWLGEQGLEGGYKALDFSDCNILGRGNNVTIIVTYQLKVKTYGLFEKTLNIRQRAETVALLPEDLAAAGDGSETEENIWQQSNFVRGRYFLKKIRENNGGKEVKEGVGIDLYDMASGHYVEGYSMNVFTAGYSSHSGEGVTAAAYTPNRAAISKALSEYAADMNKDINKLGATIEMADGSTEKVMPAKTKTLVLVLPKEAEDNPAIQASLTEAASAAAQKSGVTVRLLYDEYALKEESE